MELDLEQLTRYEWRRAGPPEIVLRMRKDGTGYYDRKTPGRVIHEKLLFKLESGVLRIKLAHARNWTDVGVQIREGKGQPWDRMGERELVLEFDPYSRAVEDLAVQELKELLLQSDAGAALPSS